jgi:hypothetical protein
MTKERPGKKRASSRAWNRRVDSPACIVLEQQTADGWVTVDASPEADRLPVHDDAVRLNVPTCTNAVGVASLACYTSMDAGPNVVYGRYRVEYGTTVLQYWYF